MKREHVRGRTAAERKTAPPVDGRLFIAGKKSANQQRFPARGRGFLVPLLLLTLLLMSLALPRLRAFRAGRRRAARVMAWLREEVVLR